MSTINDMKFNRLGVLTFTGSLNDRELKFFKANGATSNTYNNAKREWLAAKGQTSGTLDEREKKYLDTLVAGNGSLNDKLHRALTLNTYYA